MPQLNDFTDMLGNALLVVKTDLFVAPLQQFFLIHLAAPPLRCAH
jgi:hypothetical protein